MMVSEDLRRAGLECLVAERGDELMRAAVALAGSRESAEDLLQTAFERLARNWRRVSSDPEGYLRRILYYLAADGWRRRGRWRRVLPALVTQARPAADPADAVGLRDAVARLLLQLPPRQRAVLLLRYWEQLSEAETAAVLGCAEGPSSPPPPGVWRGSGNSPCPGRRPGRRSARSARPPRKEIPMRDADLTELIRHSVDELTAGARAPAGLASRVLQRDRRRRAAFRVGGIAAAGAVASAAVVIATLTAAAPGKAPGATLTADYVIGHTERALAASSSRDFIEARIATAFRPGTAVPGTVAVRSTEFAYRQRYRTDGLARGGRPLYTEWIRYSSGHQAVTMVNYRERTWWQATHRLRPAARGCQMPLLLMLGPRPGPASLAAWIRHAFRCGQLRLAGHQRIDGTGTIRLTYHLDRAREMLWVSSASWLPVRSVTRDSGVGTTTIDYRYLRPTRARLDLLRPVIPHGFPKVSPLSPRA